MPFKIITSNLDLSPRIPTWIFKSHQAEWSNDPSLNSPVSTWEQINKRMFYVWFPSHLGEKPESLLTVCSVFLPHSSCSFSCHFPDLRFKPCFLGLCELPLSFSDFASKFILQTSLRVILPQNQWEHIVFLLKNLHGLLSSIKTPPLSVASEEYFPSCRVSVSVLPPQMNLSLNVFWKPQVNEVSFFRTF